MPPDENTRKVIGAMGGTLLGACAMPQIIKLVRTRSASDISYVFLSAYILGLFLTFLYLFWKKALITWICILIQLGETDTVEGLNSWNQRCMRDGVHAHLLLLELRNPARSAADRSSYSVVPFRVHTM